MSDQLPLLKSLHVHWSEVFPLWDATKHKTYLRNTLKQDQLNSCMLVHCHKTLADTIIDGVAIAKRFASTKANAKVKKNGMSNFIFSPPLFILLCCHSLYSVTESAVGILYDISSQTCALSLFKRGTCVIFRPTKWAPFWGRPLTRVWA